jgi:aspartate kinase
MANLKTGITTPMIVAKFGGGVLNGADGLRRASREIAGLPRPAVVVVSAFADVTNQLERLAAAAVSRADEASRLLRAILDHHHRIAAEALDASALRQWRSQVEAHESRLAEIVRGLQIVGELSDRTLDLIVSFGERFASALVLGALGERSATLVSALDVIIVDEAHRYARPIRDLIVERVGSTLRPAAEAAGIAVTEGYIARSVTGEIATMGRESSDFSATLLGELLAASEVRIYTGVAGVLSADPGVVGDARTIPDLGYRAARTLAELGAKVLHPRTVSPVEAASIPLVIRPLDGPGTRIGLEASGSGISVALFPSASLATIQLPSSSSDDEPVVNEVARRTPIIWRNRFYRRLQIVSENPAPLAGVLASHFGDGAHFTAKDVAVVSVVRDSPLGAHDLARFFSSLGASEPFAILGGIERHAISAAVVRTVGPELVRSLHRAFVSASS